MAGRMEGGSGERKDDEVGSLKTKIIKKKR